MVPRVGLEPTRPCGPGILSPVRLPIPPPRHEQMVSRVVNRGPSGNTFVSGARGLVFSTEYPPMGFSLTLEAKENRILLGVEEEERDGKVEMAISPIIFVPWAITFREFLRLLYWFPHTASLAEAVLDFFQDPFVVNDPTESDTRFRLEPQTNGNPKGAELLVWQPAHPDEPALSIQEGAALTFANVLALGLLNRTKAAFSIHTDDLYNEDLFQYHGELRRIEDEVRLSGMVALWVTPEIQRLLVVSRVHDLHLRPPENIPETLFREAEDLALKPWNREEFEHLIGFLSEQEKLWSQRFRMAAKDSPETFLSLSNWIFILNLFGFLDRYLAGLLQTRMPNPVVPIINFMIEHFYIAQWEADLWPERRSALEESYRKIIPFLLEFQ